MGAMKLDEKVFHRAHEHLQSGFIENHDEFDRLVFYEVSRLRNVN